MGLNFTQLWAGVVCGVLVVGIAAATLRNCGEAVDVRIGEITMVEDAGVQQ